MKRLLVFIVIMTGFYTACETISHGNHYDYIAAAYIDTVLMGDTISLGESITVVASHPAGCLSFEKIISYQTGNTFNMEALYRFYYKGEPCMRPPGLETVQFTLEPSWFPGLFYVKYKKNSSTIRLQSVYLVSSL